MSIGLSLSAEDKLAAVLAEIAINTGGCEELPNSEKNLLPENANETNPTEAEQAICHSGVLVHFHL